jgi:WhiB family redox-sensing transcriptional regulator
VEQVLKAFQYLSWMDDAACKGLVRPDLFFPVTNEQADEAKAICSACPVRRECLEDAVARHDAEGVWGGELFIGGIVVRAKRGPGRPRKLFVE